MNEVQMEEVEDRMVIHFPYNSIRKEDDAAIDDYLNRLASELINSGSTVTITGHTDFVGESKDNIRFGLLRANSIRSILIKKGVASKQVKTRSYGESKAIATNDTPWGRYRNRRVEIRINK
jgi:outer membrane protein OmpA-like peptidoglycan-associated protein